MRFRVVRLLVVLEAICANQRSDLHHILTKRALAQVQFSSWARLLTKEKSLASSGLTRSNRIYSPPPFSRVTKTLTTVRSRWRSRSLSNLIYDALEFSKLQHQLVLRLWQTPAGQSHES